MKKRILLFIVVAGAGVALWMWRTGQFNKPTNRILVSGNLELTLVDLSFKIAGRMTELTVREGDFVKKGQLIARLDPVQLQQQRARDQASVFNAQSNYDQLTTSIEFQKATIESDIAARRADLNQAQAKLDELLAGSRPEEIQQAEAAVTDARAQVDLARRDWDRAQTLYKNEDISTSQYDQARTKFNSANAVLQQSEQRLALVKAGPRKEEIEGARAQVAHAQAAVRTAEANRLELQRKQQELVARRAQIDQARAQAGISEAQLSDTAIYAPIDCARKIRGGGRGAGRRNHHRHHRGSGTSLAARLRGRDRPGPGQTRPTGETLNRLLSRQGLHGHDFFHLLGSGIHAQADPDQRRAREAGLPHQSRRE